LAPRIAHHALEHDLTLKQAVLQLGFVDETTFDRVVDPAKMLKPYVATASARKQRSQSRRRSNGGRLPVEP